MKPLKGRVSRELYGNNTPLLEDPKDMDIPGNDEKGGKESNPDADVEFSDDSGKDPPNQVFSEEDEEAELLRELERIKREREEETVKMEMEKKQKALSSNPLITHLSKSDVPVTTPKRRWDEDVVFRNQGRELGERTKKRFINDTIRSDFHRKFLDKYIK